MTVCSPLEMPPADWWLTRHNFPRESALLQKLCMMQDSNSASTVTFPCLFSLCELRSLGDRGTKTCGGRPGSQGYEAIDAQTYAEIGVDFLKQDRLGLWLCDRKSRCVAFFLLNFVFQLQHTRRPCDCLPPVLADAGRPEGHGTAHLLQPLWLARVVCSHGSCSGTQLENGTR